MPRQYSSGSVYYLPMVVRNDVAIASLAGNTDIAVFSAVNTPNVTIQDPVDNVNLLGTIVGGMFELSIADSAASEINTPPEVILCLIPPNVNLPTTMKTAAAQKQYEDYLWLRGFMRKGTKGTASTASQWVWSYKLTTARRVTVRGTRFVLYFYNRSGTAFGAGATLELLGDLYIKLA